MIYIIFFITVFFILYPFIYISGKISKQEEKEFIKKIRSYKK